MTVLRVGFASVYAWRPHVEHLHFLASLTERAGHHAFFLTCDGDLPTCYTRELRNRPAWRECLQCRAGGVRSYSRQRVSSIGELATQDDTTAPRAWAESSASTLGRFESAADYASADFETLVARLQPAVQKAYRAARAWIRRERLDAVCVFNGRMDATRAIFEAARSLGVRVVSAERTWFGDGLQLYPEESCLGLKGVDRIVGDWRNVPLTHGQAVMAASYVARRFLRRNENEWRAYNQDAQVGGWPVAGGRRRVLLVPSSVNEVWGHPDWTSGWSDPLQAYDAIVAHLGLKPRDLLLRCHPNWSETIGKQGGQFSERHYGAWASARGVHCVPAADKTSTLALIEQCDAIVVANGSAALEAGTLGKQVIGIAPSIYQQADLRDTVVEPGQLPALRLLTDEALAVQTERCAHVARMTLRFTYSMVHRVPQYTRHVRAETTTRFRYDLMADPKRWMDLLHTGELRADDEDRADDSRAEDAVLERLRAREWQGLLDALEPDSLARAPLQRRWAFRLIDTVRPWLPVGDR